MKNRVRTIGLAHQNPAGCKTRYFLPSWNTARLYRTQTWKECESLYTSTVRKCRTSESHCSTKTQEFFYFLSLKSMCLPRLLKIQDLTEVTMITTNLNNWIPKHRGFFGLIFWGEWGVGWVAGQGLGDLLIFKKHQITTILSPVSTHSWTTGWTCRSPINQLSIISSTFVFHKIIRIN